MQKVHNYHCPQFTDWKRKEIETQPYSERSSRPSKPSGMPMKMLWPRTKIAGPRKFLFPFSGISMNIHFLRKNNHTKETHRRPIPHTCWGKGVYRSREFAKGRNGVIPWGVRWLPLLSSHEANSEVPRPWMKILLKPGLRPSERTLRSPLLI